MVQSYILEFTKRATGPNQYRCRDQAMVPRGSHKTRIRTAWSPKSRGNGIGRFDDAALAFERTRLFDEQHPASADAQLGLSLNALDQDDYSGCRSELEAFLMNYPVDERVQAVQESLKMLDEYEDIPLKSPTLAGALSAILPGSGQVYSGRYRDGAMAFVVNALFITGTIFALDNENYAVTAIVGGVGLPFYIGNIYGAANGAKKWNLSLSKDLSDKMSITLNFVY